MASYQKQCFIEISAIRHFVCKSSSMNDVRDCYDKNFFGIIIGYENSHGYHSTEIIFPREQKVKHYFEKIGKYSLESCQFMGIVYEKKSISFSNENYKVNDQSLSYEFSLEINYRN